MRGVVVALMLCFFGFCSNAKAQSWIYFGDLRTHLEQGHGVSTAGMSRLQLLNLHDSLHEANRSFHFVGRPIERTANLVSVVRPVQRARDAVGAIVKAKPIRSTLRFIFR